MRHDKIVRIVALFGGAAVAAVLGCGIKVGRDLSAVPTQTVIFDDMCGLQDYFDTVALGKAQPPKLVRSTDIEKTVGKRAVGGWSTFAFETDFQMKHLRRVLSMNWKRIPDKVMMAPRLDLEVRWAEKAAVHRAVTDQDAYLWVDRESYTLPYHVCVSELLFGERLYRTRRDVLGLPPLVRPEAIDGGAVSDGSRD